MLYFTANSTLLYSHDLFIQFLIIQLLCKPHVLWGNLFDIMYIIRSLASLHVLLI